MKTSIAFLLLITATVCSGTSMEWGDSSGWDSSFEWHGVKQGLVKVVPMYGAEDPQRMLACVDGAGWILIAAMVGVAVEPSITDIFNVTFYTESYMDEYWAGTDPNDAMDDGAGTAIHAATHAVDDRIADKTGNVDDAKNIYENYNIKVFETNQIRNANCWISDIDMTCTSIWNDDPTYHYGDSATLITPQHVVLATHLGSPIGRGYIFRATNGTTTVRRLIDKTQIGLTDITVGLLESPLPAEYTPAKLLPPNYENYLGTGYLIPVLHQNQQRQAFVVELPNMASWTTRNEIYTNRGSTLNRKAFFSAVYGHDSGNPCFMLVGSERILLYATHVRQDDNHGAPGGPHTTLFSCEIQTAMDVMSDNAGQPRRSLLFFDFPMCTR